MTQVYRNRRRNIRVIGRRKYIHELSASFFENTEARGVCENKEKKKTTIGQKKFIAVEGWSNEGRVPKVVERIVMNVGLLILHKTKVLIP